MPRSKPRVRCPFCKDLYPNVETARAWVPSEIYEMDGIYYHVWSNHVKGTTICFCGFDVLGDYVEDLDLFVSHIKASGGLDRHCKDFLMGVKPE